MKTYFFLLACCVVYVNCAVYIELTEVSEAEKVEGYACKSKNLGLLRPNEERYKLKDNLCGRAICSAGGLVDYATCGVLSAPGCKIVEDASKPYPDCCPKPDCSR